MQCNDVVHVDGTLQCSIKVKNISDVVGEEVIQVYVSREKTPVYTFPLKKLIAFARVNLKPNESKTVLVSFLCGRMENGKCFLENIPYL